MKFNLDWIIAGHNVRVIILADSVPSIWQNAFPYHKISFDNPLQQASIVIEAMPMAAEYWQTGAIVEFDEPADQDTDRLLVKLPFTDGELTRSGHRCCGQFKLSAKSDMGLQVSLRMAVALLKEVTDGLVLHASGVWRDGKAWLFCGPSGAGKTTIANELRERGRTFAEDLVVLKFDDKNTLIAESTPFGTLRDTRGCPSSAPVAGIALISQAHSTVVSSPDTSEAVMRLARESKWYPRSGARLLRVLDTITRIVSTGLCFNLAFTKTTELWSHIDEWTDRLKKTA